jgi:hypothetical protein
VDEVIRKVLCGRLGRPVEKNTTAIKGKETEDG